MMPVGNNHQCLAYVVYYCDIIALYSSRSTYVTRIVISGGGDPFLLKTNKV